MDMYVYYINDLKNYPANHHRHMRLKKIVNEHISGLRLNARNMSGLTRQLLNREANKYEKMLKSVTNE